MTGNVRNTVNCTYVFYPHIRT